MHGNPTPCAGLPTTTCPTRSMRIGLSSCRLAGASASDRVWDAWPTILGGWSFNGLYHWTTGLPFSIFPGGWSTNYDLTGEAIRVGNPGKVGVYRDASGNPNMFPDVNTAINAFRHPYPGESGATSCAGPDISESTQDWASNGRSPNSKS